MGRYSLGGARGHIKAHGLSLFPHQREFCNEGLLDRHALGMLGRTLCNNIITYYVTLLYEVSALKWGLHDVSATIKNCWHMRNHKPYIGMPLPAMRMHHVTAQLIYPAVLNFGCDKYYLLNAQDAEEHNDEAAMQSFFKVMANT